MAEPLSIEIREKIIQHKKNGIDKKTIANNLLISQSSVYKICSLYSVTGSIEPQPQNCGRKPMVSEETMKNVLTEIEKVPDSTLRELIDKFQLPISESALSRKLKKLGLTYKRTFKD
ncbi:hypothetical protein LQZ18_07295 [Lachnospiraceae bacterium ZAX-1]